MKKKKTIEFNGETLEYETLGDLLNLQDDLKSLYFFKVITKKEYSHTNAVIKQAMQEFILKLKKQEKENKGKDEKNKVMYI